MKRQIKRELRDKKASINSYQDSIHFIEAMETEEGLKTHKDYKRIQDLLKQTKDQVRDLERKLLN